MNDLCDDFNFDDSHSYVELRDVACTRLTLLNGRRGGDPDRFLMSDWKDAESDAWIDTQRLKTLDILDQKLVQFMKISYMTGKGMK